MKPEEFKREIDRIRQKVPEFISMYGPKIAGTIAVSEFKRNFQTESFDGLSMYALLILFLKRGAYHPA